MCGVCGKSMSIIRKKENKNGNQIKSSSHSNTPYMHNITATHRTQLERPRTPTSHHHHHHTTSPHHHTHHHITHHPIIPSAHRALSPQPTSHLFVPPFFHPPSITMRDCVCPFVIPFADELDDDTLTDGRGEGGEGGEGGGEGDRGNGI